MKNHKKKIQNILIRMPNWLGDAVMALPMLQLVRENFPEAKITVFCRPAQKDLFLGKVDDVIAFEKPPKGWLCKQTWQLIRKIKKRYFDLGIITTNSFSSACIFFLANIKYRLGYRGNCRTIFLNMPAGISCKNAHQIDRYIQLLLPLNIHAKQLVPTITLSDKEKEEGYKWLLDLGFKGKAIAIHIGSSYGPAKCWPKNRFEEVALFLSKKYPDLLILFLGLETIDLIFDRKKNPRIINLLGQTTLLQLMQIFSNCSLLLTNDSGPMHLASAVNCPVLAIFGSTDPSLTGPVGSHNTIVYEKISCSPCFQRMCPKKNFRCMKQISSKEVEEKVEKLLATSQLQLH